MGIFKKSNKGYRVTDDDKNGAQQQQHILDIKHTENNSKVVPPGLVSPKVKQGFFKSHTKRVKKRKNNFQRLSTSCSTPLNAYEPPGKEMFFAEDTNPSPKEGEVDASELSTACVMLEDLSPSSSAQKTEKTEQENEALTSNNITVRKSKGPKELGLLKNKIPAIKKELKKPGPARRFQRLADEESILGSPAPKLKSHILYRAPPPSMYEDRETFDSTPSDDQTTSTAQEYEPPNFFHPTVHPTLHHPIPSDISDSSSSSQSKMTNTIDVVDSGISLTETHSTQLESASTSSSSSTSSNSQDAAGSKGKFSDRGSLEFRQFVFDKQFSKIETVSVEKSNSEVGDPFLSAAAELTSKLQATVIDRYATTAPRGGNKQSTVRLSIASESSRFPSPKFPSPEPPKQTATQTQSQYGQFPKRSSGLNKVSDDHSEDIGAREQPKSTIVGVPPRAILTSSEFTVVSNMSATHATAESHDRTEKYSSYEPTTVIPEGREQAEEDPFNVGTDVDDTLWDDTSDEHPFSVADKAKLKYQGGGLKKASSVDDALIASIRNATKRENAPLSKKPDPSPRAMKTTKSEGGSAHKGGKKWIFESSTEQARDRSSKKKRTPLKPLEGVGATAATAAVGSSPRRALFSSPEEDSLPPVSGEMDKPTNENEVYGMTSPASACSSSYTYSVSEQEPEIEGDRKLFGQSTLQDHFYRDSQQGQRKQQQRTQYLRNGGLREMMSPTEIPGKRSSKAAHQFATRMQSRAESFVQPSSHGQFGFSSKRNYLHPSLAVVMEPGESSRDLDSQSMEEQEDAEIYTSLSSSSKSGPEGERDTEPLVKKSNDQSQRNPWQRMVPTESAEKSIHSNPSGVPMSAIAASMLFHSNPTESTRTLAVKEVEEQLEDGVDEDLPDVPPAVHVTDSLDAVSSITEEASSFYHKSFQLWSKTAHNALNNIQRGATFHRAPHNYRAQS